MKLELYRHLWGIEVDLAVALPKIKAFGYTGIEAPLPAPPDREAFLAALAQYNLSFIAMIFTGGGTVQEHLRSFREQIEAAAAFTPVKITSHSGMDRFSLEESVEFFREAAKIESDLGIPIAHETHRGRILFNPWSTKAVLEAVPDIQLCSDLSHWVVVCERLLTSEDEILSLAASRTRHLHARVGYEQGPQVPDPRAPEYASQLDAHEKWWDSIWAAQARLGYTTSTLTAEFGPPPYLHTLPFTNQPVANLWEICDWQAARQLERFRKTFA